ncbi:unnamed protein product [Schistocephalus solidus]|uniref:Transposase n=1 Tax=Schistocephalus solidus TaxID=70667 RepID=A0A183TU27_SCHSO|nr:unnamed protein product [Schistocephalus solidus]
MNKRRQMPELILTDVWHRKIYLWFVGKINCPRIDATIGLNVDHSSAARPLAQPNYWLPRQPEVRPWTILDPIKRTGGPDKRKQFAVAHK